jgi:hypothetical protein
VADLIAATFCSNIRNFKKKKEKKKNSGAKAVGKRIRYIKQGECFFFFFWFFWGPLFVLFWGLFGLVPKV